VYNDLFNHVLGYDFVPAAGHAISDFLLGRVADPSITWPNEVAKANVIHSINRLYHSWGAPASAHRIANLVLGIINTIAGRFKSSKAKTRSKPALNPFRVLATVPQRRQNDQSLLPAPTPQPQVPLPRSADGATAVAAQPATTSVARGRSSVPTRQGSVARASDSALGAVGDPLNIPASASFLNDPFASGF
jgi:hypothetical protein